MGQSYRLRTTPGVDENIVVQVDQDFEQLEVLSLKIRQRDVYPRMCSDYGVVAGRVFANKGYGIPNAKVSIFVPLLPEDENNPTITSIYPYKSLEDTNEDGYKYNLLPYKQQHSNHVPTGTFPTREDALTDQTVVELFDKYYKYTVTTNDSGDFMIFGVPVGTQTLVMNVDLSDMGPFSLSPADAVRMGLASEEQVNGTKFRASTNFNELPQIVVINKTIEIVPFWGENEVCQIGITRTDFDLTAEANVDIQPTAIFMGSLMSSSEKSSLSAKGRPKKATGDLCKMITGPGEIIAIRQTIFRDNRGLPVLERADIPNGGKVIDGDGVWMFDLAMNMDYVTTNEFGEQVLSTDPSVGVPTKSKYRFKIKWAQSKNLNEDYKRAYYLVPNIRERGWGQGGDPLGVSPPSFQSYLDAQRSYGFDLDWSGYTAKSPIDYTNPDIKSAVDCEDTFYEFDYNKVYTVSSFVDNYQYTSARERFLGIKRIDEETCEDSVNRYPVNDGVMHTSIMWIIMNILIIIIGLLFALIILPIYHIIAWIWGHKDDDDEEYGGWFIKFLLAALVLWLTIEAVKFALAAISAAAGSDVGAAVGFGIMAAFCIWLIVKIIKAFDKVGKPPTRQIHLQMITYPDCDACDCEGNNATSNDGTTNPSAISPSPAVGSNFFLDLSQKSVYSKIYDYPFGCYSGDDPIAIKQVSALQSLISGYRQPLYAASQGWSTGCTGEYCPISIWAPDTDNTLFTFDIPYGERFNRFNTKGRYFNFDGGYNRISVKYEPTITFNQTQSHFDNVLAFIAAGELQPGDMFSLVNPRLSSDPNMKSGATNQYGTRSITGTTNYPTNITVIYANPNNRTSNLTTTYQLTPSANTEEKLYSYASDIEYFQVVTSMTLTQYVALTSTVINPAKSLAGIVNSTTTIVKYFYSANQGHNPPINDSTDFHGGVPQYQIPPNFCCTASLGPYRWGIAACTETVKPVNLIETDDSYVVIVQRGVDPYSAKYNTEVGIGKLLGKPNENDVKITADLRLNIPIRNTTAGSNQLPMFRHNDPAATTNASLSNGFNLFFPSYIFTPDPAMYSAFTTNLHRYYSNLDQFANYLSDLGVPSSTISGKVVNTTINGVKDTLPSNGSPLFLPTGQAWLNQYYFAYPSICPIWNNCAGYYNTFAESKQYYANESLAGGSYMWLYRSICHASSGFGCDLNGWYYSNIYPSSISMSMTDNSRIIMRADRLPSGDSGTTWCNITTLLQQNAGAKVYLYDDATFSSNANLSTPQFGQGINSPDNQYEQKVLTSFDCEGMIPLKCYSGDGLNFGIKSPCTDYYYPIVKNGCYRFVKKPITDLFNGFDIDNMFEYSYRFRFFYALCQGVLSNVFNNNWVNGNLYAFPFRVNTFYNSQNQVSSRQFPYEVVMLQQDSNNFYYRSTPTNSQGKFIGSAGYGTTNGNFNQIKTPTTIMNLGPRDSYWKELVLNGNFEGYTMDNMNSSSYQDLSETINFFSIVRIVSAGFWQKVAGDQIARLFSRPRKRRRVDADFAQSAAINSQLGVISFDAEFYDTSAPAPLVPSAIAAGFSPAPSSANEVMMGIYFSSTTEDMQLRDYISPGRVFRFNTATNTFIYDYTPIKSQKVPHYKWDIDTGGTFTLFGKQTNEWATKTANIEGIYYQQMDRYSNNYPKGLTPTSLNNVDQINARGYIFSKDASGNYVISPAVNPNPALGGAPWYFYFGLKKGNSAMDKFYQKYIGEGKLND